MAALRLNVGIRRDGILGRVETGAASALQRDNLEDEMNSVVNMLMTQLQFLSILCHVLTQSYDWL